MARHFTQSTSDKIVYNNVDAFDLNGFWSISIWSKQGGAPLGSTERVIQIGSGSSSFRLTIDSATEVYKFNATDQSSNSVTVSDSSSPAADQWELITLVSDSVDLQMYSNKVSVDSTSLASFGDMTPSNNLTFGYPGGPLTGIDGDLAEFAIYDEA